MCAYVVTVVCTIVDGLSCPDVPTDSVSHVLGSGHHSVGVCKTGLVGDPMMVLESGIAPVCRSV